MSSEIIKYDLFDNTIENFVIINPKKQQLAFFPKEESQMFQGKSYENLGTRPTGYENDPLTESENSDTRAFAWTIKTTDFDPIDGSSIYRGSYFDQIKIPFTGDPIAIKELLQKYRFGMNDVNSSHTPTDYIGSTVINIPYMINADFANFRFISESSVEFINLYSDSDTSDKVINLINGIQRLRIPINIFNTILTDSTEIEENGGDDIVENYGKYYIAITSKYIETNIVTIDKKEHFPYEFRTENAIDDSTYIDGAIHIVPEKKRRTIYKLDKNDFSGTVWNFENNPRQSGRLYGSVVEVWDSTLTTLKQTKIMTENQFNFNNLNENFECVLQPDIFGYDVDSQDLNEGDILRIFPRETYFNDILIELSYKDKNLEVSSLVSYLSNDSVRDMTTGIFEIYDSNGFTTDEDGNFTGNVIRRFQIFQKDKFEARKILKN